MTTASVRLTRAAVRDLLAQSPAFLVLPPDNRRDVSRNLLRVARFLVDANGATKALALRLTLTARGLAPLASPLNQVDFPGFVASLIQGVFGAIVDASIQQLQAYVDLLKQASDSVDQFINDDSQGVHDYLSETWPNCFHWDAARQSWLIDRDCLRDADFRRSVLRQFPWLTEQTRFSARVIVAASTQLIAVIQQQTLLRQAAADIEHLGIRNLVRAKVELTVSYPGVYIEEISTGIRQIDGVPTGPTAFVGEGFQLERAVEYRSAEESSASPPQNPTLRFALRGFFANGGGRALIFPGDLQHQLQQLEARTDIEFVVLLNGQQNDLQTVVDDCERNRRIALSCAPDLSSYQDAIDFFSPIDSSYAAAYFPWLKVADGNNFMSIPAAGHIAGWLTGQGPGLDMAGATRTRALNDAIALVQEVNAAQSERLVQANINPLRVFQSRGLTAWGARTLSRDGEWRYIHVRRMVNYTERSIGEGLQWTVFEANSEALWAAVGSAIDNFLLREWQLGRIMGDTISRAYFVKCDRSTMSQADIDAGRLVVQIGVALLRPAEFLILRIQAMTAM